MRTVAYARDNILPVCIVLRGTMLLFLVFFCLAPSPERPAFDVRTRIALPFIGRFRRRLQLFSEGIALSETLHSFHIRH